MRRIVVAAVIVALGVLGILGLAELTQNRPDRITPGSTSEVVLRVRTKPPITNRQGADSLWAVCLLRAHRHRLVDVQPSTDHRSVYVIRPALGEHARQRIVGCLEDGTIERVSGSVSEVRTRPPA